MPLIHPCPCGCWKRAETARHALFEAAMSQKPDDERCHVTDDHAYAALRAIGRALLIALVVCVAGQIYQHYSDPLIVGIRTQR